ncbi:LacI family DNA-binding transcriptional regulator [Glycomyces tritici]|uniref:LacI family DNA-binding transcriptional regulator n=1 Tax=Glycomyces tritici TaxID=2665176 RepID=A0ABT7YLZ9_9ACTN|nr:LacI family DNA-binding transcriptional regulator [Glycomyces tritici]MDN3239666.1 LacI family DNA-binding transcriptional regulator [Glycomyces tritici]
MATIGDVAREAGVSRSTVSSVLTGRKFVTPETRARIEAAIAKLEYSVNSGARALATSRTMTFGVVVRFHEAEFSPALATYLVAFSDAARARGYAVMLLTEPDGAEAVRRVIAARQVDGLILLNVLDGDPRLEPISRSGYPAVLVGNPEDPRGIDAVDLDFAAAANLLVDHLADAGHRDAMFVRWPEELYESGSTYATRFERAALRRAADRGLRLVPVPVPVGPEQVRATLRTALQDPALPRTLLIHNDAAVAMLPFVLGDLRLEVPADLNVVSLHSAELARLYVLSFSAVESRPEAVAEAAVEMLCDRVAHPQAPARKRLIEPRLDQRSSVQARP